MDEEGFLDKFVGYVFLGFFGIALIFALLQTAIYFLTHYWFIILAVGLLIELVRKKPGQGLGRLASFGAALLAIFLTFEVLRTWVFKSEGLVWMVAAPLGFFTYHACTEWSLVEAYVKIRSWSYLPSALMGLHTYFA